MRPTLLRLSVLIGLLLATTAFAGEKKPLPEYALIFGTVFGPDERPLPGVVVKIRRADQKKAKWERVSDARGEFAQRVPAGKADYIVRPELKDHQAAENAQVTVHIQKDERQDIALHLNGQEHPKTK